MTIIQAFLLGILQGITEFLPISSDGHLVLAERFMGIALPEQDMLGFDVLLHAGTVLALLIVYWKTWWHLLLHINRPGTPEFRLLLLLIVATIPGAIGGFLFQDIIATNLRTPVVVAISFLATAAALLYSETKRGKKTMNDLTWRQATLIGVAQFFALGPGLSRSGLTTASGQYLGLSRRESLDFSFLMAVPIISGAIALTLLKALSGEILLPPFVVSLAGLTSSFGVGLAVVLGLRRFVSRHSLGWFALYLIPVAILVLVFNA